jgi:hypothetical protein
MNSIDIGRAFKAPFEDQNWVTKTLLGLVFGLVFFLAPAITGAMLEYIKKVSQGQEDLPEWSDFGNKWVKGLVVIVAGMIYFLPVWALGLVFLVPVFLAGGADSDALAAVASGGLCLFWIVAFIYTIAVAVLFYAAIANYALTGEFSAFFRFGEILTRVREGSGYWAAWGTAVLATFVASAISGAIPVVGWLVAGALTYLASMVGAHALGQWAAKSYRVAPVAAAAGVTGFPPAPPAPPATPPAPPAAPPAPPAPEAPPAEAPAEDGPSS